jgi:cyclopropane fatty-acyl-phospholipid synthase-like methyltransferase
MANPYDYRIFPKKYPRTDFWRQVARSVDGEPVSNEQIQMIVEAIESALLLSPSDAVLDLACGNGALSSRLYGFCRELHGVDHSEYLIGVAKEYFERAPRYTYETADVGDYLECRRDPTSYTKCLCYGSFAYFSRKLATTFIQALAQHFRSISRVFIGNIPDRAAAPAFYDARGIDFKTVIDEPDSAIGLWWDRDDLRRLATEHGWTVDVTTMPKAFFGSHYRFDATLRRTKIS